MCTGAVSLAPDAPVPLLLLGVRDEFTGRPWRPPARHWPGSPLIGGIDEQAGGTWLAVHPGVPRVACLLNSRGFFADPARPRRGGEPPAPARRGGPGRARRPRRRSRRARCLRPVPPDLRHPGIRNGAGL